MPSTVLIIVFLVLVGALSYMTIVVVPAGQSWMHERFGRFVKTMTPGVHFILPGIDGIGPKLDVREAALSIPLHDLFSRDQIRIKLEAELIYQVTDAAKAAYTGFTVAEFLRYQVFAPLNTQFKLDTLEEILKKLDATKQSVLQAVTQQSAENGIEIKRLVLGDLSYDRD